ncbi:MAG: 30S ribosome-binding factor RbfA, partial [Pseudoflavonifractor sp.]
MPSNRLGRINEEIQRELSGLIRNLKDPRVHGVVSITAVETTPDLRYAKVFVSVLDRGDVTEVIKGLKSAGGYLRRELGGRLTLR